MAQHTPLYIIASQHPRVGKTLVARLLIEYFRLSGRPIVGYDLDPREPALASHFPSFVWPVDTADTRGQMALFDRLVADDWRTTVLDIGYGLFDQFFTVLPEIGFEQEAARRGIVPIVLFITDAAPTTARRYAELQKRLPRTIFVPVHNEATAFMFIPNDFPPTRPECGVIRIPRLSPIVRGVIDRPGFSFGTYLGKRPGGPTEVHTWIDTIFSEFRELELRLLIGEIESSLRGYAGQSGGRRSNPVSPRRA
ncbi:MAG TPA: hypothetical protein VE396_04260 [Xanthobacteraceae bacterium]|jgi:hypothetical protein|nr:hypothetical protein [Xanthobacteraceae bacterium]